jgi:osmotically-inducible protein OsmY
MDEEMMTMRIDKELQQQVMDELAWEPSIDAAKIGASVDSGGVLLSGTVRSLPEKWAAERAAERVNGVRGVADEIVVKLPGTYRRDDMDIARAALDTLGWNVSVPHGQLKVLVENGWITLDGTVERFFQKSEAERVVRNLLGVNGVVNRITVKPVIVPADVKNQMTKALERTAEVDAKRISVEVCGTTVILSGAVKSWVERGAAERAAWAAPGVANVENMIEIGG